MGLVDSPNRVPEVPNDITQVPSCTAPAPRALIWLSPLPGATCTSGVSPSSLATSALSVPTTCSQCAADVTFLAVIFCCASALRCAHHLLSVCCRYYFAGTLLLYLSPQCSHYLQSVCCRYCVAGCTLLLHLSPQCSHYLQSVCCRYGVAGCTLLLHLQPLVRPLPAVSVLQV